MTLTARILALSLTAACLPPLCAEAASVKVAEQAGVLRVETQDAAVRDVLAALARERPIEITEGANLLEGTVSGVYSGGYDAVIGRLLVSYNHVILHRGQDGPLEIRIIGRVDGRAGPAPSPPAPPPGGSPWRIPPGG